MLLKSCCAVDYAYKPTALLLFFLNLLQGECSSFQGPKIVDAKRGNSPTQWVTSNLSLMPDPDRLQSHSPTPTPG